VSCKGLSIPRPRSFQGSHRECARSGKVTHTISTLVASRDSELSSTLHDAYIRQIKAIRAASLFILSAAHNHTAQGGVARQRPSRDCAADKRIKTAIAHWVMLSGGTTTGSSQNRPCRRLREALRRGTPVLITKRPPPSSTRRHVAKFSTRTTGVFARAGSSSGCRPQMLHKSSNELPSRARANCLAQSGPRLR